MITNVVGHLSHDVTSEVIDVAGGIALELANMGTDTADRETRDVRDVILDVIHLVKPDVTNAVTDATHG